MSHPTEQISAITPGQTEPPALVISGLSKSFANRKALDKISLELPAGACLSIFGPNGAGKSTLLQLLATLLRPSSGNATVLGHDLKENSDQIRAQIGLIAHRPMLYPDLSAEENLIFLARLYGVCQPQKRVTELLDAV